MAIEKANSANSLRFDEVHRPLCSIFSVQTIFFCGALGRKILGGEEVGFQLLMRPQRPPLTLLTMSLFDHGFFDQ